MSELDFEPSPRRVRVFFGGEKVADSERVMLMREAGHMPVYYFPREDVREGLLEESDHSEESDAKGGARYWHLRVRDRRAEDAVWGYPAPFSGAPGIDRYYAFRWNDMDHWYEEDEEVYVHPRDPHKRIDVIESSRHVRVVVGGRTVAETRRPRLLFETGLPTRYYLPAMDTRMELLAPSELVTRCPYKGEAHYYSIIVGGKEYRDLVWYYRFPTLEASKIADMLAFFNERVDELWVDGKLQEKPKTRWS